MKNTENGAKVYSPLVLKLYDWWVLKISNNYFWKCSTKSILLPFFKKNLSQKHLDVGVGSGFYLKHAQLNEHHKVTLMDLNVNSLKTAAARLYPLTVKIVKHDIMQPLPEDDFELYDSISLFYLIHCLPGEMLEKELIFDNLKKKLATNGVIYGATILGEVDHNFGGAFLIDFYNKKGIFGNKKDNLKALKRILNKNFNDVEINVVGQVALFEARGPIF